MPKSWSFRASIATRMSPRFYRLRATATGDDGDRGEPRPGRKPEALPIPSRPVHPMASSEVAQDAGVDAALPRRFAGPSTSTRIGAALLCKVSSQLSQLSDDIGLMRMPLLSNTANQGRSPVRDEEDTQDPAYLSQYASSCALLRSAHRSPARRTARPWCASDRCRLVRPSPWSARSTASAARCRSPGRQADRSRDRSPPRTRVPDRPGPPRPAN